MNGAIVVGATFGGMALGFISGVWLGLQEGGDFNFAPAIYGPMGAAVGAGVGVVVGVLVA